VTGPSARGRSDVDLGADNPTAGNTVTFTFTLPTHHARSEADGHDVVDAGRWSSSHRANTTATAAILEASPRRAWTWRRPSWSRPPAVAAGDNFFNTMQQPPQSASMPAVRHRDGLIAARLPTTVQWYLATNGTDDPRTTAVRCRYVADGGLWRPRQ